MREDVIKAAEILAQFGVVAMPTETVYGLAGDARNDFAVRKIFKLKGRPTFNPLIVHVMDLSAAMKIGEFSEGACRLADVFWPGPLTIVVPLKPGAGISSLVTAGLDTVAIRSPAHPIARMILAESGRVIAAPSANRSGQVSPTCAAHVRLGLPEVDFIVDGGETMRGIESTIVQMGPDDAHVILLRPGPVTIEAIAMATGLNVITDDGRGENLRPIAPGALLKHYAPKAAVRLDALDHLPGEGVLGFGPEEIGAGVPFYNLSETKDLDEAAQRLFAGLHWMDEQGVSAIAVRPIPLQGVGLAINDRLNRAAAQ